MLTLHYCWATGHYCKECPALQRHCQANKDSYVRKARSSTGTVSWTECSQCQCGWQGAMGKDWQHSTFSWRQEFPSVWRVPALLQRKTQACRHVCLWRRQESGQAGFYWMDWLSAGADFGVGTVQHLNANERHLLQLSQARVDTWSARLAMFTRTAWKQFLCFFFLQRWWFRKKWSLVIGKPKQPRCFQSAGSKQLVYRPTQFVT